MSDKSKVQSKFSIYSEVESKGNLTPVASSALLQESENNDYPDNIKSQEKENNEIKDEIETIQSSDNKTDGKASISEETTFNTKKIDLEQAYKILEENSILNALIKSFSSPN